MAIIGGCVTTIDIWLQKMPSCAAINGSATTGGSFVATVGGILWLLEEV